ncbi:MAG: RHS repeat-associated core domain-containing protein, partial [Candidatus Zixiibacteriota bacterium]
DTKHRYTGKEHDGDDILNQDYFGARYLHGNTLRFTAVDPQAARYPGWSPYCYALGNPIRLKDTEGEAVEDFVYGLAAAVLNNFTIGGSPRPDPQNYPSSGRTDLQIGMAVGDVASAIGGAAQTLAGASAAGLSVAAAPAGAISLAALPAAAGVAAHGVGVVATAGGNIGKDIASLRASDGGKSWSTARREYWKREARENPQKYSPEDVKRMEKGDPPQRMNPETGKTESKVLHHKKPRREGGTHDAGNLQDVWPDEHEAIDPYRHTGRHGEKP